MTCQDETMEHERWVAHRPAGRPHYTCAMPTSPPAPHLNHERRLVVAALAGLLAMGLAACAARDSGSKAGTATPSSAVDDRQAVLLFRKAVEEYAALHRRLVRTLPRVAAEASSEEVYAQQVTFEKLIANERAASKAGDLFIAEIQPLIRRVAREVLSGRAGAPLLDVITEESTEGKAPTRVNARYPDGVPLSSVPAQLLSALPTLPEELEYRFVGRDLILLDTKARLVADVMPLVLPR